jgi:putative transposase
MKLACAALGLSRATAYRRLRPQPTAGGIVVSARVRSHRRIPEAERGAILDLLDSERFIDQPPREVYAALLSEATFACSWRTMYRLLRERGPVRDRRGQREPRHNAVPALRSLNATRSSS